MSAASELSDEMLARLFLLDLVYDDCFALKEFTTNLDAIFHSSPAETRSSTRRLLAELAESGALRVHSGPQCGPKVAPATATIAPSDMDSIPEAAFDPYSDAFVCICPTDASAAAYDDLLVELGSPDWRAELRARTGILWG